MIQLKDPLVSMSRYVVVFSLYLFSFRMCFISMCYIFVIYSFIQCDAYPIVAFEFILIHSLMLLNEWMCGFWSVHDRFAAILKFKFSIFLSFHLIRCYSCHLRLVFLKICMRTSSSILLKCKYENKPSRHNFAFSFFAFHENRLEVQPTRSFWFSFNLNSLWRHRNQKRPGEEERKRKKRANWMTGVHFYSINNWKSKTEFKHFLRVRPKFVINMQHFVYVSVSTKTKRWKTMETSLKITLLRVVSCCIRQSIHSHRNNNETAQVKFTSHSL